MTLNQFIANKYYWDASEWESYINSLPTSKANELQTELNNQHAECYQLNRGLK
jgi:hypothetical protein